MPKLAGVAELADALDLGSSVLYVGVRDGGVPEWPKGTDCKSVSYAFAGSNPASSTNLIS